VTLGIAKRKRSWLGVLLGLSSALFGGALLFLGLRGGLSLWHQGAWSPGLLLSPLLGGAIVIAAVQLLRRRRAASTALIIISLLVGAMLTTVSVLAWRGGGAGGPRALAWLVALAAYNLVMLLLLLVDRWSSPLR